MQGIEMKYCDVCVGALIAAWRSLMEVSAAEALTMVKYGKSDTLGLDCIPEITISRRLKNFDGHAILVTEELDKVVKKRWPTDADPIKQPMLFFCDPTDRSDFLKKFIQEISKSNTYGKVGNLMIQPDCVTQWNEMFEKPATITGATSAITCVRKGEIIFSVILNYVTQTIFIAVPKGVYQMTLPNFIDPVLESINMDYVLQYGQSLSFLPSRVACPKSDDYKRFVTFLGKTGYRENFDDSMIFVEQPDDFLHHTKPGGPARILYLSELQKGFGPIGFILANGEKISEWIHWLSFAKYAKNKDGGQMLKVFEISIDRPWTKDGVLMSTSRPYSIFAADDSHSYLDVSRLRDFDSPSKFRSMLVVTPFDNERIINTMQQHEYREISLDS